MLKVSVKVFNEGAIDLAEKQMKQVIFASNLDLFNAVVDGTPVDTGFARASWWVQSNESPGAHPQPPVEGQTNPRPAHDPVTMIAAIGETFSLVNNAAYIRRLEYEGHSPQNSNWVNWASAQYYSYVQQRLAEIAK